MQMAKQLFHDPFQDFAGTGSFDPLVSDTDLKHLFSQDSSDKAFTTGRNATEGVHDLVRNVGEDRDQTTNSSRRSIQAKHMRHHQSDNLLSFPEQGFTSDFVPIQVKDEKLNYDLGSTDHHARNEHSDLSAGTASCLDTVQDQSASRCCFVEDKKKKVGRPIAYRGDPNAMSLTDTERRRIKRRIANRESARRVRARRQGILEELEVEMEQISKSNARVEKHIADVTRHTDLLKEQMQSYELQQHTAVANNARLHQQVSLLRAKVQAQAKSRGALTQAVSGSQDMVKSEHDSMAGSSRCCSAPGTGISCALIDELPFMALPMSDTMLLPTMDVDVDDSPHFML